MTQAAALRLSVWIILLFATGGCGVVGPPIAPEDVGLTPIIERQKKQQAGQPPPVAPQTQESQPDNEPIGQDQDLPPLRPIGTR